MIDIKQRLPPYSEEAERCVLGSILLDPERVIDICTERGLGFDSFYIPSHRVLYEHLVQMRSDNIGIDIVTACQYIKDHGGLDAVGGNAYIEQLIDTTPSAVYAERYIEIVVEKFLLRCTIERCRAGMEECYRAEDKAESIIFNVQGSLIQLSEFNNKEKSNEDIRKETIEHWKAAQKGGVSGIPSPWPRFNERFGGLHNGIVTVFGGRAGTGKSSANATWLHFLGTRNIPVAACCFEDGVERTWQRLAGIHGDFSVFNLDVGNSTEEDVLRADQALLSIQRAPIYLEDRPMSADQILAWAMRQKAKHGIKVLFIDAFKDIARRDFDVLGDNEISQAIAHGAKRLDLPIVVYHHMRKQDTRDASGGRLTKDDIRGSGRIMDDCRQAILLQAVIDKGTGKWDYEFELVKNNFGPTGSFPMIRISNRCKWIEKPPIVTDGQGRQVQAARQIVEED